MKLLPLKFSTIVENPSQAAALAKVPVESRVSVLKAASKNGPITAKSISEAAKPKRDPARNADAFDNEPGGRFDIGVKPPEPKHRAAPSDNGKPKWALPIWKELREDLIGRAINRVDALNKVCPNSELHKTVLGQLKAAFATVEKWNSAQKKV